jgi:DNA-binding transcriptional LysR family regulator
LICAAPTYLKRNGAPEQPNDLQHHEGLLPAVSAVRREITLFRQTPDRSVGAVNVVTLPLHPPALSTSQLDMILASALAGLGVAGLPSFMVAEALREGRLVRVLPEWHGTVLSLFAAMPTRKNVPARTRVFIDFLVQTFGGSESDPWLTH